MVAHLSRHENARSVVFAAVMVALAGPISYWQVHRPIAHALTEQRTPAGVILQSSDSSCSAATLANIASSFGHTMTEREAAELMGTTPFGTSPGQMRYALRELGIAFEMLDRQTDDLAAIQPPAFLFVDHPAVGSEGHTVGYFGECEDDIDSRFGIP